MKSWRKLLASWWGYNWLESVCFVGLPCLLITILIPALQRARERANPGQEDSAALAVVFWIASVPAAIFVLLLCCVVLLLIWSGLRSLCRPGRDRREA